MPTINQLVRKGRKTGVTKSTAPALQHGWNSKNKKLTNNRAPQKRGVCTVVTKLFNIVNPDRAYFGEKDAQQLAIIRRFVRDLNIDIEIIGCPIIREEDGLAKSSRNTYLSKEERQAALILSQSLNLAKDAINSGERNSSVVIDIISNSIKKEPLAKIDYIEVVDSLSMKPVKTIEKSVLVAIAVYIGKTRLIDNFTFNI